MTKEPENDEEIGHYNALPKGYQLHEYRLDAVLGVGGFGITYLAWDENLNKRVAIKEYLPAEFAVRAGAVTVQPKSSSDREDYQWGLDRFMEEAQMLARFQHQSIVQVFRFFEAHGTAYMVMNYEEGEAFSEVMDREKGTLAEGPLLDVVLPLLDGLQEVHTANVLHRDIKPGNIYIRADGSPVLLDFGAARDQIGRKSKGLTSIVTPGYAPLEQYHTDGNQGPWTDIYAMGAILYQAISGKLPPEAPGRVKNDSYEPASEIGRGRYSEAFLGAIDWALEVDEDARPLSVGDWRGTLSGAGGGATVSGNRTMVVGKGTTLRPSERTAAPDKEKKSGALMWALVAVVVLAATGAGGWYAADRAGFFGGSSELAGGEAPQPANPAPPTETAATPQPEADPSITPEDTTGNAPRSSGKPVDRPTPPPENTAEEDARRAAEDAKRRADEDARRRAAADAKRQAEEDARRRADDDAKRQAEEDARRRADDDAKRRADEDARRRATDDAARQAEEDARRRAAEDARQRAEEDARRRAADDAKRRAADEAKRKALERRVQEAERRARDAERKAKNPPPPPPQTARLVSCPWLLPGLGAQLPVRDCSSVSGLLNFVLENKRTGEGGSWRSRDSKFSGTVVPVQTYTRPDGIPCRRFRQTVKINGQVRRAEGTACRSRSSAEWKIVL